MISYVGAEVQIDLIFLSYSTDGLNNNELGFRKL